MGMWAGALATLAVFLALVFGPACAGGQLLAPGDGWAYYLPMRQTVAQAYQSGIWPFWNPFQFGGMPLLAVIQAGVFYPGNFPFLVFDTHWANNLTVLLALLGAAVAMMAYLRAISLGWMATLVGSLTWLGSGYLMAHLEHLTMLQTAMWLPAGLWAIERYARTRQHRFALGLACCVALQSFAGYPQTVVTTLLLLAIYALWRTGLQSALVLGGSACLGLGLSAIQWFPTLAYLPLSARGAMTYEELVSHSLPIRQTMGFLFPYLFGSLGDETYQVPYWGVGPWLNEVVAYAGILPLILVTGCMQTARRGTLARFWLIAATVALLLAWGGSTPLYWLWAKLPVFSMMRVPGRHLLVLNLAVAVLSGLGMQAWLHASVSERRARWFRDVGMLAGVMLVLGGGMLALKAHLVARWQPHVPAGVDLQTVLSAANPALWVPLLLLVGSAASLWLLIRNPVRPYQALVLCVLAGDLWHVAAHQSWSVGLPHGSLLGPETVRSPELTGPRSLILNRSGYPFRAPAIAWELGAPQLNALQGRLAINGYEPMMPARLGTTIGQLTMVGQVTDERVFSDAHHGCDLLGVSEVILEKGMFSGQLRPPRWQRLPDTPRCERWKNTRVLPDAWRVGLLKAGSDAEMLRDVTQSARFDPRTVAWVETAAGRAGGKGLSPGMAQIRTVNWNEFEVTTSGKGPGFLVLQIPFSPGWRCEIAGRPLAVERTNGVLLGLFVPKGRVTLSGHFEAPGWRAGRSVSLLGVMVVVLWAVGAWLVRRRRVRHAFG